MLDTLPAAGYAARMNDEFSYKIKSNDDMTWAFTVNGQSIIDRMTIDEAFRLRDAFVRLCSPHSLNRKRCLFGWRQLRAVDYDVGKCGALQLGKTRFGDDWIHVITGGLRSKRTVGDVEGFVRLLPRRDQEKARDIFARYLEQKYSSKGKHSESKTADSETTDI